MSSSDETLYQNIDETVRRKFEAAWQGGVRKPIEDFLPSRDAAEFLPTLEHLILIEVELAWKSWSQQRNAETSADQQTIEQPTPVESYVERFEVKQPEIIGRLFKQEFVVRLQYGEQPTLDEYRPRLASYGIDATRLTADLPTLLPSEAPATPTAASSAAPGIHGQFGDYEIVQEIGRGGMGVVYRARQKTADRDVALKVIRQDRYEALAPDTQSVTMERFWTEAQAAARLDHENIVTVFDVGEIDGQPYYSMRYVEGPSLAELLREGPLNNRRAVRYIEQVGRALHEAHTAGVLHRDLKPHNIMLDKKNDRALVADFGLAKVLEHTSQLTHAGDVMGTPSYMSPEQATDAGLVSEQTDIYALGATLYHLVAGRPPFQAANPLETMRQVIDEEPVAPSELNRAIDRDLETICLKCLRKDPDRSYDTAGELSADVARYLAGEPIHARPVGTVERTVRWCKRNPVTAGWIGAAMALLVVAIVSLSVGYSTATAALRESELSDRQTRETLDYFFTQVSENVLLDQPGLQPLRESLLREALKHYRRFLARRANDADMRAELGLAYYRVARITEMIDSPQEALPVYERAEAIQQSLFDKQPDRFEAAQNLATTLNAKGGTLGRLQQWDDARDAFLQARQLRLDIAKRETLSPDEAREMQRTLANTHMNIGITHRSQKEFKKAEENYEKAHQIRGDLIKRGPDPEGRIARDLAMGYYNHARLARETVDLQSAEQYLQLSLPLLRQIVDQEPGDQANQQRLATCYWMLGQIRADLAAGQPTTEQASQVRSLAIQMYQHAVEVIELLAKANPRVVKYQQDLAAVRLDIGIAQAEQGQASQAIESLQRACEILEKVVKDDTSTALNYAIALYELGRAQKESDPTQARKSLEQSQRRFGELLANDPDSTVLQEWTTTVKAEMDQLPATKD